MSLRENEQRRSRRALQAHRKEVERRPHKRHASTLATPFALTHPNQILTFRQWCRTCVGFLRSRGKMGVEAYAANGNLLGLFPDQPRAAAAISAREVVP
jgi:hypothetical protein